MMGSRMYAMRRFIVHCRWGYNTCEQQQRLASQWRGVSMGGTAYQGTLMPFRTALQGFHFLEVMQSTCNCCSVRVGLPAIPTKDSVAVRQVAGPLALPRAQLLRGRQHGVRPRVTVREVRRTA